MRTRLAIGQVAAIHEHLPLAAAGGVDVPGHVRVDQGAFAANSLIEQHSFVVRTKGRTGDNVIVSAGFTNDDGDLLDAAELATLKADAQKWRNSLKRSRDRKASKKVKS